MNAVPLQKRKPKRSRTFRLIELSTSQWHARGRMRDISSGGALVEADDVVPTDAQILLRCGDFTVTAEVSWVDQKRFGLKFDQPLSPEDVIALRGGDLVLSAPRAYRPGQLEQHPPRGDDNEV